MRYEAGLNLDKFRNSAHFYAITDWLNVNYPDCKLVQSLDYPEVLIVLDSGDQRIGEINITLDTPFEERGAKKYELMDNYGEDLFVHVINNPGRSQYD